MKWFKFPDHEVSVSYAGQNLGVDNEPRGKWLVSMYIEDERASFERLSFQCERLDQQSLRVLYRNSAKAGQIYVWTKTGWTMEPPRYLRLLAPNIWLWIMGMDELVGIISLDYLRG